MNTNKTLDGLSVFFAQVDSRFLLPLSVPFYIFSLPLSVASGCRGVVRRSAERGGGECEGTGELRPRVRSI